VKRKCDKVPKSKQQQTVLNVFSYTKTKNLTQSVRWIANETTTARRALSASAFKIQKEAMSNSYSKQKA
jgi:hypothetical protein